MKNNIILIATLLITLFATNTKAQENLLKYGDFEEFVQGGLSERPKGWLVSGTLSGMKIQDTRPGGKGTSVLGVYANGGNFQTLGSEENIVVSEGKAYRLSFWHKGNVAGIPIKVRITWYHDEDWKQYSPESMVKTSNDWMNDELYFTVPTGKDINRAEIRFTIDRYRNGGDIRFDDIELSRHEGDIPAPLAPPTNIKATPYQREIELTWDAATDPNTTWEVSVFNKITTVVKTNSFTIEQLDPEQPCPVKIRTVVGAKKSDFSKTGYYWTAPLEKSINSPERIPYLRTIEGSGSCSQRIKPYFNDLGNKKAVITYSIDGTPVELQDGFITFPSKGNHQLIVTIDEGNGRKYKLTYRLSVK